MDITTVKRKKKMDNAMVKRKVRWTTQRAKEKLNEQHHGKKRKKKIDNSDVIKSRQPAIFASYCPFPAGYFCMSKKK